MHQIDDARRKAGFLEQLDQALADGRRVLRRLEDGRVAFERLGPSIHSGTAKGKFHGVMTATTPHGLRRMKASFSAISEASTSPIGIRPVPKTYWIMCNPSTTSARHSVTTLPHSRAMSWARSSVSRLTIWARLSNSSARRMRLVRRQAG